MYAVIRTGGKQYKVAQGDWVDIEKLDIEAGGNVTFDEVLLVGDENTTTVGTPLVAGATVTGTVESQHRGEKVLVFKYRRRQNYRNLNGHRQSITRVNITGISLSGGAKKAAAPKKAAPVEAPAEAAVEAAPAETTEEA